MTKTEFVKWLYPSAKLGDINPVFTITQAALETGWGKTKIGEFNLFGVTKGSSWKGDTILVLTTEIFDTPDRKFLAPEKVVSITKVVMNGNIRYKYKVYRLFRKYKSLSEALSDHQRILQLPGYSDAWPYRKSATEYAKRICDNRGSKYATDPNYLKSMLSIIKDVQKIVDSLKY